jgi:hypothetical protein
MRTRSTKKSRFFFFRISVTPFKFKLLLATGSVLNSLKHLVDLTRALQQFTEHDFGDIVHFLSVLFHLIFFGSVCLVGCSVVRAGLQRKARLISILYSLILAACLIRNVVKITIIKSVPDNLQSILVVYVANVSRIYVNGLDR